MQKFIYIFLAVFTLASCSSKKSAIVTSKKEAIENGTYSYSKESSFEEQKDIEVSYEEYDDDAPGDRIIGDEIIEIEGVDYGNDNDYVSDFSNSGFNTEVVNKAMKYEGVKYKTGGTTKKGMDCSGLVYTSFKACDITLPRTSYEMAKAGKKIKLSEVQEGDLLFFDNNPRRRRINHVGLVTEVSPEGDIKFIHASLQLGVTISSLNEPYYRKSFVQANRVVTN
ncbi:hypothetical protein GCM10007424_07990 [Flavobacterium suaedae]|uniref:NlpC/P60 domain-containing protein n=1 Tax=Flavobacterium suaedae TaxID=1767027 RepID=A0ABQ1JJC1_9FLAO|nr:C40 family peptidase [Flavobacterium suaedae]GGB70433.1 hypothetical protein GCM10007424_07990 [Flavobacterium suaedae]